jgi:hypothetical protein
MMEDLEFVHNPRIRKAKLDEFRNAIQKAPLDKTLRAEVISAMEDAAWLAARCSFAARRTPKTFRILAVPDCIRAWQMFEKLTS